VTSQERRRYARRAAHEYTADFVCRNCGFEQPEDWYRLYRPTLYPCKVREKAIRHARALWRKACATMECGYGRPPCVCGAWNPDDWRNDMDLPHEDGASALLDGLRCEDLP